MNYMNGPTVFLIVGLNSGQSIKHSLPSTRYPLILTRSDQDNDKFIETEDWLTDWLTDWLFSLETRQLRLKWWMFLFPPVLLHVSNQITQLSHYPPPNSHNTDAHICSQQMAPCLPWDCNSDSGISDRQILKREREVKTILFNAL